MATYLQGGTGIPAGETNYPGAAAHMRPAAATGFRGVESDGVLGNDPHPLNIYAPVLQDTYSAGVLQPNSRLYIIQDANWDTTAIIGYNATTGTWSVVQRYVYSPYGTITILNPDFTTVPTGTVPMVNNLYQGMPLDPVTGLYYERARWYSPSLGTWISQDPAGYINGADTYQFVESDPVELVDPWGEDVRIEHSPQVFGLHERITVDVWNKNCKKVGTFSISFGLANPNGGSFQSGSGGPAKGGNGSGIVYQCHRPPTATVATLHTTPCEDRKILAYLRSLLGETGPYNVLSNNCRDFSWHQFEIVKKRFWQKKPPPCPCPCK